MSTLREVLINKEISCKPIWFMRQAGRYLPEFRKIRSKNPNFIKLCLNSELSSEITLQPIKRYNLDSAIIFSDILMIPYALGQKVVFTNGVGPKLSKLNYKKFIDIKKENFLNDLNPIYEAISRVRKNLNKEKSLIAFVGAPWTLLVYMLSINKTNKTIPSNFKINNIDFILEKIIEFIFYHIESQVKAGADVIQIFDSWAGLLPKKNLNKFCFQPNLKIVNFCKSNGIPVICFPKGIKKNYLDFNKIVKPNGLNLDYETNPDWAKENLMGVSLQGGMDPKILLEDENKIISNAKKYLDIFKNIPYIFNLGHGILPNTDPIKIEKLVNFVRKNY